MSDQERTGFWRSKMGIVCAGFLAVAAFFLVTEHTAHVLGALPWLLLAACPLMHLFMHHGHSSHDDKDHADAGRTGGSQTSGEQR